MPRLCSLTVLFTSLVTVFGRTSFNCPEGFFKCNTSQSCITSKWRCDGENDCQDKSDEKNCDGVITCQTGYYKCRNGRCIDPSWICDRHADCPDKDDEAPIQKCNRTTCGSGDFQCRNGDCIQGAYRCDYEDDCEDKSDEKDCPALVCTANQFKCAHNRTCISDQLKCNGVNDCTDGSDEKGCSSCDAKVEFRCNNTECIPNKWRCDGDQDCIDHSDEDGCPSLPPIMTCADDKFRCGDGSCIGKAWLCDKDKDCDDGTDELECPATITCSSTQFTCDSGKCIPGNFRCNGYPDCPDGSDEARCDSPCDENMHRCGTTSLCVNMTLVCNNIRDCPDGDDESHNCDIDECSDHKGHCHHNCIDLPIGYKCSCNIGYKLANDSRACEDVNECEEIYGTCSQTCVNNKGSYKCSCVDGYIDEVFLGTCKASGPSPYLLFTDEHRVRNLTMSGSQHGVIASNRKGPTAVDYDLESGYVYWTEVLDEKISRARLNGDGKVEMILDDVQHSNGLAVDWVGRKLYWTDENSKSIEVSELSGSNRLKLFNVAVGDPRGIAVDPFERLLFWTDWGSVHPKIERASMDGNSVSRIVVLDTDMVWPTSLTLDPILQRVYFADTKLQMIETCKYDGTSRKKLMSSGLVHPLSLAVFEDYLFYTDYSLGTVFSVNKLTGHVHGSLAENLERPSGITVVHPLHQKHVHTKCSENNGGCSHLCLLSTNVRKYSCLCPEGMRLHSDGKTCGEIGKMNETTSRPPVTTVKPSEKHATTACSKGNGGCSHTCLPNGTSYICGCPKDMVLRNDDVKTCVNRTTAKENGTEVPLAAKSSGSSSNSRSLIAGLTVALLVVIIIVVAIIIYWRKRSNFRGRTILFYKDNSRTPLQSDFDEDPLKTPEEIGWRSRVQLA